MYFDTIAEAWPVLVIALVCYPLSSMITVLFNHGLIGACYLLSAWLQAYSESLVYRKEKFKEYSTQALDATPKKKQKDQTIRERYL